ncbi:MAG: DMT family transporter [Lonepinella koalarum]|nr:DMT family transporter [Lonepinella koalarum]
MKFSHSFFYNAAYILLLGAGFPLLRYMSQQFDANNNNMVRFFAGSAVLFAYGLWKYRSQYRLVLKSKKLSVKVLALGSLMATNMYLFIQGLSVTNAVTGSIFSIIAMPLAIGLAAFFYTDERERVKQPRFYVGSLIAIFGSLCFVLQKNGGTQLNPSFLWGTLFLFLAITIQGIQSLIIKSMNNQVNAVVISTFTALLAALFNLFISISTHKITQLSAVSEGLLIGLVLTGIYGIVTGMFMSFHIVQKQGIVTYNLLQLVVPFSATAFAYLWLNETIGVWQIVSGILIIFGCLLALKTNSR